MHIPDGVLDPVALGVGAVAAVGAIGAAAWTMRGSRPRLGLALGGAGLVLAAHLADVPLGGGVSAHLVGGALLAVLLGPSLAILTMTAVLAFEAVVLGDGGVAALGVNVLVMAVVGVMAGWGVMRVVERWRVPTPLGSGVAGVVSVVASAAVAAGLGGETALVPAHLAWGLLEGGLTMALVAMGLAWRRAHARLATHRLVRVLDGELEALG